MPDTLCGGKARDNARDKAHGRPNAELRDIAAPEPPR
jgi:hypothetical protein